MMAFCFECKRPCDEHNSKYLTGKDESIEFGYYLCYECYYLDGWLVEVVTKVEQADKMIDLLKGVIVENRPRTGA